MRLTKKQKLTLYSLGQCYKELNKRFEHKPLAIFISKIGFIEILLHSQFIDKKERALYKNLETLEKKRLINYKNKRIRFTKRGFNHYNKICQEIKPFLQTYDFLQNIKTNRKLQPIIKS